MQLVALVVGANGRTCGERCDIPPTWLSVTACDWLDYGRLSRPRNARWAPPSILWVARQLISNGDHSYGSFRCRILSASVFRNHCFMCSVLWLATDKSSIKQICYVILC